MIHLHKQLWAIIAPHRDVEDSEHKLAYMTHREYNKDGVEAEKYIKRKHTGNSWAQGGYGINNRKVKELEFDNTPLSGFTIIGSQSRWSTDNKVIQVEDPRGFVVEIPVSALTTLLKHTTVVKGVVKEECVWGREGNNHILIPVNSDIYLQAKKDTHEHNNKIKFSQLDEGDKIKFKVDGPEYIYAGKYKAHWEVKMYSAVTKDERSWVSRYVSNPEVDTVLKSEVVLEDGYKHLFLREGQYNNYGNCEFKSSGSCILISTGHDTPPMSKKLNIYPPNKVIYHFGEEYHYWHCRLNQKEYSVPTLFKLEKKGE